MIAAPGNPIRGTRACLRWAVTLVCTAAILGLTSCRTPSRDEHPAAAVQPKLAVEVIQLRRDQVLQRVEVAVRNRGTDDVIVERVQLDVAGFHIPGPVPKNSPVPAGQVVNLPVPYGDVTCPADAEPRVGQPRVTLQVRLGDASRQVRLQAQDRDGLLQGIATRICATKRTEAQVAFEFADRWRLERRPDGDLLHGTLRARLRKGPPRSVNQIAGAIMYGLRPDPVGTPPSPLATLSPSQPMADIPVVAYAARCDGHTIGEIKKPYEFLVWVSVPGGEDIAISPQVGDATKQALRRVCAF